MVFKCDKDDIYRSVSSVLRAVPTRAAAATLEGVLLEANKDFVSSTGYNLRIGIRSDFDAEVFETGAVVVDRNIFSQILSKLPNGDVSIKCDAENKICITSGKTTFNIAGMSAEDFPELPSIDVLDSVEFDADTLTNIVNGVAFAASDNESKPLYTGVLFEIAGKTITAVALDGYRMAVRHEPIFDEAPQEMKFVLPADSLREAARFAKGSGKVTLRLGKLHAAISANNTTLITRRLEGEFMDWKNAIASQGDICVPVDRDELATRLDRVSVVLSDHYKAPVVCEFADHALKLSAETPLGRADERCSVGSNDELKIGFNYRYLLDALKAADGNTVRLIMKNSVTGCFILPQDESDDSFAYLVLPVRIKDGK